MTGWGRALMMTAVLVLAAAGVSTAQSVTVTRATPGARFEVALNGAAVGDATVGADGLATVDVNLPAHGGKKDADVRVSVEVCGNLIHVLLMETGLELPPANPDCTHNDITGVFVMHTISSFVVDVGPSTPSVWLMQGPAPQTWLHPELMPTSEGHNWRPQPKGLIVGGAYGFAMIGDFTTNACGTAATCNTKSFRPALQGEVTYWLTRSLGATVSFLKPNDVTVQGSDTNYSFASTLQTSLLTVGAKLGVPAGPTRLYAIGGATYHRAVVSTSETIGNQNVTVNGATVTIPGGTQAFGIDARGWDWLAGGGLEISLKGPLSIYAEGGYSPIKSGDRNGGEARVDARVIYAVAGLQIHLWR